MITPLHLGITGACALVIGAAWPISKEKHPGKSIKNWLFLIGALFLLGYASWNYSLETGEFFFVLLQIFVLSSNVLLVINAPQKWSKPLIISSAIFFIGWSIFLFEDLSTLPFIIGLSILAYGYISDPSTRNSQIILTIGSILLALFSYLAADWVFFWLNSTYILFSSYYAWKLS